MAYKIVDGNGKQPVFIYPHQDILVKMTESLREGNLTAYIDLVEHLKNLSILAFDDNDFVNVEKVEKIKSEFRRHIDKFSREKLESSALYSVENVNSEYNQNASMKIMCEFKFAGIIERICITALRKTILRDQIPEAQGVTVYYKPDRDIKLNINYFNAYLEERGIQAMDVTL
ncbi:MAG: hypothetical protein QM426_10490 [Euryarchaeota archaeon]|nr:hypothetical protein [Euryarchaeota archaeon]